MKWKERREERLKWHIERKLLSESSSLLCILLFCLPHSVLFLSPSSQNYHFTPLFSPLISLSLVNFSISTHFTSDPKKKAFFCFISLFCFSKSSIFSIDPHEVSSWLITNQNVNYLQFYPSSPSSCFHLSTSLILSSTCPASEFSSSNQPIFHSISPKSNHFFPISLFWLIY